MIASILMVSIFRGKFSWQKQNQRKSNQLPLKAMARINLPRWRASLFLQLYQKMLEIRRFEEKVGQLYGMGLIGGFCHLYIGQEADAVGTQANLETGDSTLTSYRDHGHALLCGLSMNEIMAELTGRAAGCSSGKGGSMHMFAPDKGFYGGHGIVAAQVPIGTGLAFGHKYRGDGKIAVCYFGDGRGQSRAGL